LPHFKTTRRVAVPAHIAYDVAADVAAYKEFLPLLERSVIRGAVAHVNGVQSFNAELAVGYERLNLREAFLSKVTCNESARTVTATSQDAPFKSMTTVWSIQEMNGQSEVSISIEYVMRSMMLQFAVAATMDMAVNKVMTAFEARAKALYTASMAS
jgi:coenzyme Q-binding protein COQ10